MSAAKTIPFEGRQVPIQAPLDFDTEDAFRAWLEGEAYLALARHRKILGEAEYQRAVSAWVDRCAAGCYCWGSESWYDSFFRSRGLEEAVWLGLQRAEAQLPAERRSSPDFRPAERELARRMVKDPAALELLRKLYWAPYETSEKNGGGPAGPSSA